MRFDSGIPHTSDGIAKSNTGSADQIVMKLIQLWSRGSVASSSVVFAFLYVSKARPAKLTMYSNFFLLEPLKTLIHRVLRVMFTFVLPGQMAVLYTHTSAVG